MKGRTRKGKGRTRGQNLEKGKGDEELVEKRTRRGWLVRRRRKGTESNIPDRQDGK